MTIGKFTVLPIVLLIYKSFLLFKIKAKNIDFQKLNYLNFIKKYLPGGIIVIIIIAVTTNNIFAQTYSSDEYANRTLLVSLLPPNEETTFVSLIEESGPATNSDKVTSYLEDQGNLQELVIDTPFKEETTQTIGTSPDETSLVMITPEEGSGETSGGPTGRTESVTYTVGSGDVLGAIAEKFNISVNTILWANGLTWNSTIKPGQKLVILPSSGINYEIKKGDTVSSIAKKYQSDSDKIINANKLANASDISVGDLLFIPNGVKPTQVVSSYQPKTQAKTPSTPQATYGDEDVPDASDIDTGTKLLWPVLSHRITQYYSWRHYAIDIGDKIGNPIYAAEDGKIERAGWNNGYGNNVVINHGNGIKTLYGHSSKLLVHAGDTVSRGQVIALIGSTGWSTGPHLHLEVIVNGSKKNPLNYIK